MYLFLCSQDLEHLFLGLVQDRVFVRRKVVQTNPEGFLGALDSALKEWSISTGDLLGIIVVIGPGSFTASRLSVTVANAIAFRFQIPIWGVENADRLSPEELFMQVDFTQTGTEFVQPVYDRPPFIT